MLGLVLAFMLSGSPEPERGEFRSYFCDDIKKPFFSRRGDWLEPARAPSQAKKFSAEKPPGVSRVFVLGESVAALLGRGELQERAGRGLELINCGMGAYDSYRVGLVLREALDHKPDMLVLLSGNNENPPEFCPGPAAELRRRERALLGRLSSLSKSGGDPGTQASLRIHERRVRAMAAAARRRKVPLVICSLPANELMPPYGSLPLDSAALYRGQEALRSGDHGRALAEFSAWAAAGAPAHFAEYLKGLAKRAAGRGAGAARHLSQAVSLSPAQERTSRERNAMLRRVAAEEGACFADLDALFRAGAPSGIPGFELFSDGIHWRPAGNNKVWDAVFSAAAACGIKAAGAYRGSAPGRQDTAADSLPQARLSYAVSWLPAEGLHERTVFQLGKLAEESPALLERAAVSPAGLRAEFITNFWSAGTAGSLESRYPAFLLHLSEAYRRAGRVRQALAAADKAAAAGLAAPELNLIKARILHALGRRAEASAQLFALAGGRKEAQAAAALGAALGLPAPVPCFEPGPGGPGKSRRLSDRGARHMAAGRNEEAEKDFLAAAAADPGNAGALLSLCMLERRRGRPEAALERCAAAAAAALGACGRPSPAQLEQAAGALLESGRIRSSLGRSAEAAKDFRVALKTAPAGWGGAAEARALLGE